MATPKSVLNIHPKVLAALLASLGTAAVGAILAAVNPGLFNALGAWGAPAYALLVALLGGLGGWLKKVQADTAAPAPTPVPTAPTVSPRLQTPVAPAPVTAEAAPAAVKDSPATRQAPAASASAATAPAVQSVVIHQ